MGGRGPNSYSTRNIARDLERRISDLTREMKAMRKKARVEARREYISGIENGDRKYFSPRQLREFYRNALYDYMGDEGYGSVSSKRRRLKKELNAIKRGQRSLFG